MQDGGASEAGLGPGDGIVHIDNRRVSEMSFRDAIEADIEQGMTFILDA